MSDLKHAKSGRWIGNKPRGQDDFGDMIFQCPHSGRFVTIATGVTFGTAIPQANIGHPDGAEAHKENLRAFAEANCNMCRHFQRLPA